MSQSCPTTYISRPLAVTLLLRKKKIQCRDGWHIQGWITFEPTLTRNTHHGKSILDLEQRKASAAHQFSPKVQATSLLFNLSVYFSLDSLRAVSSIGVKSSVVPSWTAFFNLFKGSPEPFQINVSFVTCQSLAALSLASFTRPLNLGTFSALSFSVLSLLELSTMGSFFAAGLFSACVSMYFEEDFGTPSEGTCLRLIFGERLTSGALFGWCKSDPSPQHGPSVGSAISEFRLGAK
jgi:hypothetical protein